MICRGLQRREAASTKHPTRQDPKYYAQPKPNNRQYNIDSNHNSQIVIASIQNPLGSCKKLNAYNSYNKNIYKSMIHTPSSNMGILPMAHPAKRLNHSKNSLILSNSSFMIYNDRSKIIPEKKRSISKGDAVLKRSHSNAKSKIQPLQFDLSFDESKYKQIFRGKSQTTNHASSQIRISHNDREMLSSSLAANDRELKKAMIRVKKEIMLNTNSTLPETNEANAQPSSFNITAVKDLKNSVILVSTNSESVEEMHAVLVGFYQRAKKMTEKLELDKTNDFSDQKKTMINIDDDLLLQSLI